MECKQEVQYTHFEIADFGQYQKGTKRLSKQKWCNIEQKWCDFTKKRRDLEQMWFRTKNSAICEQITLLRANQIAGITSDFKMDIINEFIWNQIKNFMSPLAISSMHGFWGGSGGGGWDRLRLQRLRGSRMWTLNYLTMVYDRMRITRRKVKLLLGNNHELLS